MSQLTELQQPEFSSSGMAFQSNEVENVPAEQGIDVVGILLRRKWIIIMMMMLGVGLGYIYLLQASPVYESLSQVLIEDKKPPSIALSGIDNQFMNASAEAKHAIMIQSPRILLQAFDGYSLGNLTTFSESDDPMLKLTSNLDVQLVQDGTNVLSIGFRGANPEDTQAVLTAILTTYQTFLQETYRDTGRETRELIVTAKDDLMRKWQTLEGDYGEFKVSTPLMYKGEVAINMHSERQADYEAERVLLQKQLAALSAQINAVESAIADNVDLQSIVLLAEQNGNRMTQENMSHREALIRDRYMALVLEEEELVSRYGKDHPDVLTKKRQKKRYEDTFPEIVDGETAASSEQLLDFAKSYLKSLTQRQIQLKNQDSALSKLFEQEQESAKKLQSFQAKDERYRNEIERTQKLFEVVVKSLEEISLVSDYEGYNYQTLAAPGLGDKVAPSVRTILPISAFCGLLFGFGIAYLIDMADNAFRSPDEVGQVMRLPVIGHVPLIDVASIQQLPGCEIDAVICTVHKPKSPQAESYRAVRTALYFNSRGSKHQVIQVTSPMPGDGKSTLAANLAVTIAQSGKSTLLLDADFRRPTQHKVFAINSLEVGLASVVAGDADPADAWREVPQVPNLRVMACGPRPDNPSELLSSEDFANVLETLREQFDFVIVDTPPVLAVSDPSAVAARVDGVIMTFRIHKRAKPLATRAREVLSQTGVEVIGVVVNGVEQDAGGYYSGYSSNYGGGYRYAYNYRYGEGYGTYGSESDENRAIQSYYDEEAEHSSKPTA
ncbi:MAG: polysaccharide biosynthesis tyrosine autokinase [Pirellulaceae bacterium]|nr:polysaccharide biosynthesis tyrosine autokinase [Pirellulaceae bacterium]